jgi:indole-3-glycerol phosphate synthase
LFRHCEGYSDLPTVLEKIVKTKWEEVAKAKQARPIESLLESLAMVSSARDFLAALAGHSCIRLIAEVKKASPSKGVLREDFDPVSIAKAYEVGGAACLSVLTDKVYFQGSLDYLTEIRKHVKLPLLRKDFIVDDYQLVEARLAGADAVLLIAECLSPDELKRLYLRTRELGMHALIEFYEPSNLDAVVATGCPLIGVNNRDLHTFEVDLMHTVRMRQLVPRDRCMVGESGIFTHEDAQLMFQSGVQAILVGESLIRQPDITHAVQLLLGNDP